MTYETDDILSAIQHYMCDGLKALGNIEPNLALAVSQRVAVKLSTDFGGQAIYINKQLANALRNKAICTAFTGNNYLALAKQYGVTERQIRNIVEDDFKAKQAAKNPTLFDL